MRIQLRRLLHCQRIRKTYPSSVKTSHKRDIHFQHKNWHRTPNFRNKIGCSDSRFIRTYLQSRAESLKINTKVIRQTFFPTQADSFIFVDESFGSCKRYGYHRMDLLGQNQRYERQKRWFRLIIEKFPRSACQFIWQNESTESDVSIGLHWRTNEQL